MMNSDDLFTASKVAEICSVDLKTIHNWVGRGEIQSFRTPGGHLRFRRQDIMDFLNRFHYPIPKGFTSTKHRIAILAGDQITKPLMRSLSRDFEVEAYSDSFDALLAIGNRRPDLFLINTDIKEDSVNLLGQLDYVSRKLPIVAFGTKDVDADSIEFVPTDGVKQIKQRVISILGKN